MANLRVFLKASALSTDEYSIDSYNGDDDYYDPGYYDVYPEFPERSIHDYWDDYEGRSLEPWEIEEQMNEMFKANEEAFEEEIQLYLCRHGSPEEMCTNCEFNAYEPFMPTPDIASEQFERQLRAKGARARRRRDEALHRRRRVKVAGQFNPALLTEKAYYALSNGRPWQLYSKPFNDHFGSRRGRRRPDQLLAQLDQAGLELAGM